MKLTHTQNLVLTTLNEHKAGGGRGIGNAEIDREMNLRHNRTMGYDALHSLLVRLTKRGLVKRAQGRPARWSITPKGAKALGG